MSIKINKRNIENAFALSPLQEGILFHYLSGKDTKSRLYFEQLTLGITGDFNTDIFKQAWNFVVEQNSMLRTVFRWENVKQPVQITLKKHEVDFNYYDLSEKFDDLIRIKQADIDKGFNLEVVPFRVTLCRIEDKKYEIILSFHHIILDGWSTGIIFKEFCEYYYALLKQKQIEFKPKADYYEYIKYLKSQDNEKALKYWQEYLHDAEECNFTIRKPLIDNLRDFKNKYCTKKFTVNRIEDLNSLSSNLKVTNAAIIYSAWALFISVYNNSKNVVFGTTVSGRNVDIKGIKDSVGLYINAIPLFSEISYEQKISDYLLTMNEDLKAREGFELVSLADILSKVNKRDLFDSIVVIENYPLDRNLFGIDNMFSVDYIDINETTNYPLTLSAEFSDFIIFKLSYNSILFDNDAVDRLCVHFERIFRIILDNTQLQTSEIEILSDSEKQQLLYVFNDTAADYPREKTIHQLFEEQVERAPDNVALVFENNQITYIELNNKSNQLARTLRESGVKADEIVGVMVERSLEMIIGIMGILKAGGAYLPIDPDYPSERKLFMLEDSSTKVLLTSKAAYKDSGYAGDVGLLDNEQTYSDDVSNLPKVNKPSDLAYIIYTSGTTGKPKGVMVEHKSVINTLIYLHEMYPLNQNDSYLLKTSYCFDVSVSELFGCFFNGVKLVILDKGFEIDPREILTSVEHHKITHINFVPSVFNALIQTMNENEIEAKRLGSLKYILIAGEAFSKSIASLFQKHNDFVKLENIYGPTESSVYTSVYSISDLGRINSIPIGKPISNTQLYIVNKSNRIQPIWISGELLIGGVGLARGYLNRPELTAEKFVYWDSETGEVYNEYDRSNVAIRVYMTGDLCRWLPDGNIEFLGRIDYQVKIRGFRIELGEIESQLLRIDSIKESVVIAKDDKEGQKYLVAYILTETELETSEIRSELSKSLPDYMIPSYFVRIDKIPLTSNGKIDRRSLPDPEIIVKDYVAPRNEIEEKLVEIWSEVLGIEKEKISVDANFFELGGHSLKATILMAKIHKAFDVKVALAEIFKTPMIIDLGQTIKKSKTDKYASILPAPIKDYYSLSSAQKRLYILQQMDLSSTAYNIPQIVRIGEVTKDALELTVKKLIDRHESFRTSFDVFEDEPMQKIHEEVKFELEYYETREDTEIDKIYKQFVKPFDLNEAPLLRVGLIKDTTDNKSNLLVDMHHIISDGVSMELLKKDFMSLLKGESLEPLRLQYKDYSEWQNSEEQRLEMKKQEEYWLHQYQGEIPVLNLPYDYTRPVTQSFEGAAVSFVIDEANTKKIRDICKETNTTLYMFNLAILNILLSKLSGQEDIIVGMSIAGRRHSDLEKIIGMFVNTLALRNYPKGELIFEEFLNAVKISTLSAYDNQEYQFEELVEKVSIVRDFSRNPIFDVCFNMLNITNKKEQKYFERLEHAVSPCKFDIDLDIIESNENILVNISYSTRLFIRETIDLYIEYFKMIIRSLSLDKKLSELQIITESDKELILFKFNNTEINYPTEKVVIQFFEEQVKKTPDNVSLVFECKEITYRVLNERANKIAELLRLKCIQEENIVGIMTERSIEMIIGVLGILKAGAAYLAIEPDSPVERTNFLIEDCQVQVLLTDSKVYKSEIVVQDNIYLDSICFDSLRVVNLEIISKANNLVYVIYTSGTTGKPKAIMAENRNAVNYLYSLLSLHDIKSKDISIQQEAIAFDGFMHETYSVLSVGGKVIIPKQEIVKDILLLHQLILRQNITLYTGSPLVLNEFNNMDKLPSIRRFISSSDVLKFEYISNILKHTKVFNMYGPSEATVCSTCYECNEFEKGNIKIGKPIHNYKLFILDKYSKILPYGIAGELHIGGAGLTRGYLKHSDLTAEKFIWWVPETGKVFNECNKTELAIRIYCTGDLCRWLQDGNVEFLGRIDNQVKIRGYRIELGEIEHCLTEMQEISEAIIVDKVDKSGDKNLCAYYISENEFEVSELKKILSRTLPDYMIPSYFVRIDKLPLTSNGKVDRRALPDPEIVVMGYIAPRNEIEEKLVVIWSEVLGIDKEKISIDANFFELGGHSLKATILMSKIHKVFDVKIALAEIFKNPSIDRFATNVTSSEIERFATIERVDEEMTI